ncbi:MAG: hypothetical protein HND55_11995 [Pseudomonadota bacterium]|nr:MAG: hypothetical protein HND55_11995 [Pseudomonadota bacterium]
MIAARSCRKDTALAGCSQRLLAGSLCLLALALTVAPVQAARLDLQSGPGQAGPVHWQSIGMLFEPVDKRWQVRVEGLMLQPAGRSLGNLMVDCADGSLAHGMLDCRNGHWQWQAEDGGDPVRGQLVIEARDDGLQLAPVAGLSIEIRWPQEQSPSSLTATFSEMSLSALPDVLRRSLGLSVLEGRVDGEFGWLAGGVHADLVLSDTGFDRSDGWLAAAGLDMQLSAQLEPDGEATEFAVRLQQTAGELLAGSLYLPQPGGVVSMELVGAVFRDGMVALERIQFRDPAGLALDAAAQIRPTPEPSLSKVVVERLDVQLEQAWPRWAEGLVASHGLDNLAVSGRAAASGIWQDGQLRRLALDLDDVSVVDPDERFALTMADLRWHQSTDGGSATLAWDALELLGLPFGPAELIAERPGDRWRLSQALRVPLLDGAVVIDAVDAMRDAGGAPVLTVDARVEPLNLTALTRLLGFPEFGGTLSGQFPGVVLQAGVIAFTGGIEIRAFSGLIALRELVIERPFGTLPALAAQVDATRLDLAQVTAAFDIGHMEGELSGWMHDLRLLDWRPVAMDARFFTHDDAPQRRISQRAVENLSSLGGSVGGALVSNTILPMFETFPYERAGLACRLSNNICHLDGVAPHESGGFYIVEGRGLPRLNIIGHRRLVDWPRLIAQLADMVAGS